MQLSFILNSNNVHSPHVDLFSDLCTDFCNAHLAFEFRGKSDKPSSPEEWAEWWECGDDYEEPFISRAVPTLHHHWKKEEMEHIASVFTLGVQRVIVARMLPDYLKHARRVFVGSLFPEVYDFWIESIGRDRKPVNDVYRNGSIPSHREKRRPHKLRKTTWKGILPNLGEQWFQKKWIGTLGHVFRAHITELTLTHNSFNYLIVADFIFEVEFHDGNKWSYC